MKSGEKFGRLTAIKPDGFVSSGTAKRIMWLCVCECGAEVRVRQNSLVSRTTKSCGCLRIETASRSGAKNRKHGLAGTAEYRIWTGVKNRCFNKNSKDFGSYGGKGITVCERFADSPSAMIEDIGRRPSKSHSLDRIDNRGNYSCGKCSQCKSNGWSSNCRWATDSQQRRNRSDNSWHELDGKKMILADWAREFGIDPGVVHGRISRGWCLRKALETPVRKDAKTRRDNVWIECNGMTMIASEWAEKLGVHVSVIIGRIKSGWTAADAVTLPIGRKRN